jgi:hypothetical protein
MSAHTITADRVAAEALKAGHALWRAVELAGLRDCDLTEQFGIIIDQLGDARPGSDEENALWHAATMQAVPLAIDGAANHRTRARVVNTAWLAFVRELEADEADQVADHRADLARDVA